MKPSLLALCVALLATPAQAFPEDGRYPNDDDPEKRPSVMAERAEGALRIDGVLDEADWEQAEVASGFRQFEPEEGAAPTFPTAVRVVYGTDALYIGAVLYDDQPGQIQTTLGRRDQYNQADWFTVSIDAYLDRKTAYNFAVNAGGVQVDGVQSDGFDTSWDAVWESAARVTDQGWVAEMKIPYAMLRFTDAEEQTWGINFRRWIPRLSESDEWVLVRRSERRSGVVSHYGRLEGLNGLKPRRNLQITPYTVSSVRTSEGEPGQTVYDNEFDFGGDIKYGISSNITLDATINPDFGQVESDPAELNLSAFETFFSERRPFFVEGVQIFDFSFGREGSLLYTRRIGGRAPIIAASKLSGRTEGGLSFGVMAAATGNEFDPSRYYGVVRLLQEVGRNSRVGLMGTGFERAGLTADGISNRRSFAGGADWDLRFRNNRYRLDGYASLSHRRFPSSDDAPETGAAGSASFDKIQGDFTYGTSFSFVDDVFNVNDLGRLRRGDLMRFNLDARYQLNRGEAFGPFRRATVSGFSWQNFAYTSGLDQGAGFWLSFNSETKRFQEIQVNFFTDYLFGGYDLYETRGLDARRQAREFNVRLSYETDSRRNWELEPSARFFFTDDGARSLNLGLESDWNVGERLTLSAEVELSQEDDRISWASNETFAFLDDAWHIGTSSTAPTNLDPTNAEDYAPIAGGEALTSLLAPRPHYEGTDQYYVPVFGARDTRRMEIGLRSNITFTPNLSLQLYGQLFVARGQYDNFQLLQDRESLAGFDAYPKRHDFAFNSFQTNVVLRWEYRPGSTLFLVWSQARSGNANLDPLDGTTPSPFGTRTLDQFRDTFDLFPENVFLIKLNYLFLR